MIRHVRIVASLTVAALILIACGSRVVPLEGNAFVDPSTGEIQTDFDKQPVGESSPGTTTGPVAVPTASGPGGSFEPVTPGCEPGRGDVGVDKDSIKLGLIASITGPLPGQFDAAVQAVDAYFKGINEAGGICGRRVELLIRNDNGNGSTNKALAKKLVEEEKIFAFVGSHSAPDDSGIADISRQHKVPDIGFSLTWERAENPYSYGVPGQIQRAWIGEGASGSMWLNEQHGIEQVAIFWLGESEVSILSAWAFESAMIRTSQRRGKRVTICYEQKAGVVDNNYTNYVVAMKGRCDPDEGPIAVYSTMENNANINLARAMRDQNFQYTLFAPTFSSYLETFISQADGATEGAYIAMPQIPFERLQRPESEWTDGTRELARYVSTLQRFYPNPKPPGSFGGPAWGQAALFTEAASTCGSDLTRACLFKQLDTMGPFAANGFLSPVKPSSHKIYTADLIVQVRDGRFTEVRPNDRSGPPGGPDFWDRSTLFNWWDYYCANKHEGWWPNTDEKDRFIEC